MNQGNLDLVDTAFLQLSFALKLWHFLDEHPIDRDAFDIALTVEDEGARICLPHNQFESYDAIRVASEHNISLCFGAAANTLWEAMREKSGRESGDLNPDVDRASNIASLTYMIRCCFAHGPAAPVWQVRSEKYKTQYHVGNKVIDLSDVAEGTPFDYGSIGGYETLWFLKAEALAEELI